jgi:S1-C subfamily serine protease
MIQGLGKLGTGFYITADGDIVTASHVVGDRVFNQINPTQIQIILTQVPYAFLMRDSTGEFTVPMAAVDVNADNWGYDLAVIHSRRKTSCWLAIGDDKR